MNNRICILLACIAISGCAQITPYRMPFAADAKPCIAQTASECSGDAYYYLVNKVSPKLDDIPIGIVEFDDQGVLQDRPSKEVIMDRIRSETDEHGAFVVVFAHGWLNNAAPDNGNLAEFQALLKRIAADDMRICEGRTCANRKVVGVYLAWRGMSATLEPFKSLSFWNRKTRAERVGQDGATEILADLAQTQRGGKPDEVMRSALAKEQVDGKPPRKSCMPDLAQNPDKVPCNRTKSRLIVIGHSFGKRPRESQAPIQGLDVEIVEGDVLNLNSLFKPIRGIRGIFHLAGIISIMPGPDPIVQKVNVDGTKNVLKAAKESGVKKVVYTSSIHAIQRVEEGIIDENIPYDMNNPYGAV